MPHVLIAHSMFGQFRGVVGPFESRDDAEKWGDKYTQHGVNTIEAVELMNPAEVVAKEGLDT